MNLRVLRYFLAAVEAETISGAAKRLYLTQPTLSRQFQDLEEELGHRLFERSNSKLRLTAKGELFRDRARAIVELCEKTKKEMLAEEELSGDIRIAAGETQALRSLARAIAKLQKIAPKVRCHIISGSEETVQSELRTGLTDLGVFVGKVDLSEYASLQLKNRDQWGILTRKNSTLGSKTRIEAADLIGEPLICSRQAYARNEFAGWLNYLADDLTIVGTFNLLYNAYLLAEAGVGHVLSIDGVINPAPESHLVWIPLYPTLTADITVVWEKNRIQSKPVQMLLELLRKEEEEGETIALV